MKQAKRAKGNDERERSLLEGQVVSVEPLASSRLPEEPKARRSWSARLDDGAGQTLRVFTIAKKAGTATTYVVMSAGKGKAKTNSRGLTSNHTTVEAARAQAAKLIADAEKAGWTRAQPRGGFVAREDAFSAIPKAGMAKK